MHTSVSKEDLERCRSAGGGDRTHDSDGWRKPVDMRDVALEEMRQELAAERAESARWRARVQLLETRLEAVREALVKR